jgi:hypothetical protein
MAEVLANPISELKQRAYWSLLSPKISIEEWEGACKRAMLEETYSKIPLPAVLLGYAMERRQAAPPRGASHTNAELLAIREANFSAEEIRTLIASIWPEEGLTKPLEPWDREASR